MNYKRNAYRRSRTSKRKRFKRNKTNIPSMLLFLVIIISSIYLVLNLTEIKEKFLSRTNSKEYNTSQNNQSDIDKNSQVGNNSSENNLVNDDTNSGEASVEENNIKISKTNLIDENSYIVYKEYFNSASSFLTYKEIEYTANFINDFNMETAWTEGVDGDGINEWVEIKLHWPDKVNGIIIENGYKKTKELYYENNRPKTIEIELTGYESFIVELEDEFTESYYLELPKVYDAIGVKITILDVYKGSKYKDTCISEIHLTYKEK
jgi:hypothetical protein